MPKPEITFKMGAVRAAVFQNIIKQNGESVSLRKVVLEVRYRDKAGQWKGTNSLSVNDLPKAISVLQKAYEYILGRSSGASSGTSDPVGPGPQQRQRQA